MEIILLKKDVLFMFVQVSVFWNFCNGYIQLCQDSNIESHNGTTVTAEIGKPASLLFCVTSDRILHIDVQVVHPSHRRDKWIRITERPEKDVSKFNKSNTINITIDNVQRNDFNVSFSVKVYTQLNGSVDHNDFLILAFILQQQNYIHLCQDKTLGSDNGTTVTADIGKSASVTFCVTSSTTIYNDVFIDTPSHRSGWNTKRKQNGVDVKIVSERNYAIVSIVIEAIEERDLDTIFSVRAYTEGHARGNFNNNDFIIFTFFLKSEDQTPPPQEKPAHNPPDKDSKIRDIGLTAGIVLVATAFIAFLIHCYRMKSLRRSRQLVIESKPEGRSRHNEIPLLLLARDQTEHISGSGQENISGEQPASSAELNSPYIHYEEIRDVGTNSLESSDVPADRAFSDIQREEVDYDITVPKTISDNNQTPYVELVDRHNRTPATSVSSADKGVSQCHSVVEYENTRPVLKDK